METQGGEEQQRQIQQELEKVYLLQQHLPSVFYKKIPFGIRAHMDTMKNLGQASPLLRSFYKTCESGTLCDLVSKKKINPSTASPESIFHVHRIEFHGNSTLIFGTMNGVPIQGDLENYQPYIIQHHAYIDSKKVISLFINVITGHIGPHMVEVKNYLDRVGAVISIPNGNNGVYFYLDGEYYYLNQRILTLVD
jgi:hypothetical protein